jgi:hypothetical protein
VRLSEQVVSGLADLVQLRDRIRPVIEAAVRATPIYGLSALGRAIDATTGSSPGDSFAVLSALFLLHRLQRHRHLDAAETVQVLSDSITRFDHFRRWSEAERNSWDEVKPDIRWALDQLREEDNAVLVSEKAESLAWSHQNVLFSTRLITDARPVFNADGTKIKQVVLTTNLHIEYGSGAGMREKLVLAMDAKDVRELRIACERAEVKMQTCLKNFENHNPVSPPVEAE